MEEAEEIAIVGIGCNFPGGKIFEFGGSQFLASFLLSFFL